MSLHRIRAKRRLVHLSILLLLLAALLSGCSRTTRKIGRDILGSGGDLKRKVALTVFGNMTVLDSDRFNTLLQREMVEKLSRACSDAIIIKPDSRPALSFLAKPPVRLSGSLDAFVLAENSRKSGINIVVSGNLISVKTTQNKKGLVFKDIEPMLQMDLQAEVYDTETGAKLLEEVVSRKIVIDETEYDTFDPKKLAFSPVIEQLLQAVVDAAGEKICDAVNRQPWKAYITAVDGPKVIVSSGRETGLVPGDVLTVFDSSIVIDGMGDRRYFQPGPKIGEIKITAVFQDRSEAVTVSGENFKVGSAVLFGR